MTPESQPPPRVLIVDDDRGLLRLLDKALRREGFATANAGSGHEALAQLHSGPVDLMLLDLKLPDFGAKDLVEQIAQTGKAPPFIIITGQGDERVAVEMMKRGARDYLVKDIDFLQLMPEVVKRVLRQVEQERRLAEAEAQVHIVRSVVEQGFSAVLIASAEPPEPRVVYINPTFAQATGLRQTFSSLKGLGRLALPPSLPQASATPMPRFRRAYATLPPRFRHGRVSAGGLPRPHSPKNRT